MHTSALDNANRFQSAYTPDKGAGLDICEIGAQNINGSLREVFPSAKKYLGVDFVQGNGVDLVLTDPYKIPIESHSFDLTMCSSVFEHSDFFWLLFLEMARITKPGGYIYINVPSCYGHYHQYPVDCWRFMPDAGLALSKWSSKNNFPCILLESYISNQVDDHWNDFVGIFKMSQNVSPAVPARIISAGVDFFTNGIIGATGQLINASKVDETLEGYQSIKLEHDKWLKRSATEELVFRMKRRIKSSAEKNLLSQTILRIHRLVKDASKKLSLR